MCYCNGRPMDLTGVTVKCTVKEINDFEINDSKAKIVKTIVSHIDAVNGVTEITFTPADTNIEAKEYKMDLLFYSNLSQDAINSQQEQVFVVNPVTYGS